MTLATFPSRLAFLLGFILLAGCTPTERTAEPDLARYIQQLRVDVQAHPGSNSEIACFVDLTLPDTGYRFFLLDLKTGQIRHKGLCLNGRTANGQVLYSNQVNSNCSSRGLARIASRYIGSFGRAYRLTGLEASTSNLAKRAVVLHSWPGVPAQPVSTKPIESQGCPTLNPEFLNTIATYLDASRKPVLIRLN